MTPSRPPLPRDFHLVTAANFVFFLNFSTFFLLPIHLTRLGASEETVGYVMGTAGFAGLCVLPFLGRLLDRIDRRRFTIAGAAVMALASFAYVVLPGMGPALYVLRVVQGVSFTAAFVAASTLAADLAPPARRGQALGVFGISTLLTHAIAPALGEQVADRFGFPVLFAAAGTLGLVALGLSIAVRPPARARVAPHELARPARPLSRSPLLWMASATMVACGMGFGAVLTFVPTFLHAIHIERVAPFFLAYTLAAVSVRILLGGLSDRLGRRRVLLPSVSLLALAILLLGAVHGVPALVVVGLLFGAGQGMTYPTANALMVDLSHPGNLGRVQTLFAGSFSVGAAASAFVFGGIIERYGYPTMFASAAACVALGAFLLWLAPREATLIDAALAPAAGLESPSEDTATLSAVGS
jgi:MFS family permease